MTGVRDPALPSDGATGLESPGAGREPVVQVQQMQTAIALRFLSCEDSVLSVSLFIFIAHPLGGGGIVGAPGRSPGAVTLRKGTLSPLGEAARPGPRGGQSFP